MRQEDPARSESAARYYALGDSWSENLHGSLRASRRLAWTVAAGLGCIAVLEAVAIASLAPLKTVVPYTITVDRQTGYLETAQALKPGALSQDSAVTQAFLAQYVLARETFDAADLQPNYRKVAQWTAGAARDQYLRVMATANPQAPQNLYPAATILKTTVKSVSLLSRTTALVRFDTERQDAGGAGGEVRPYAAVIAFRYTGAPMRMEDRLVNPLGFSVISYRRDAESLAPVAPIKTAAALP